MKERRAFGGATIMAQMVNLSAFMGSSTVDVYETGFRIPVTESS
jgi:hypothetical protein